MAISRGYNMLDFAFSANIGERLSLSYKTRKFHEQIDTQFIARWCESNILQLNGKCVIFNFGDVATGPDGETYLRLSARPEIYFEPNQDCFVLPLVKSFSC